MLNTDVSGLNGAIIGRRSCHLSGIMNGLTHVTALAGDASPVARAQMLNVETPKKPPINVGIELLCAVSRYTVTRMRFERPVGPTGNSTSPGPTDTLCA